MFSTNIWGVLVAALACFILGFLFHGPFFGKLWMKLANITPTGNEKLSDMTGQMIWNFVANVVAAWVLAVVINLVSSSTLTSLRGIAAGVVASLLVWAAVNANSSIEVIWMGRKIPLWLFEVVSSLVCYVAMGIVIALI